MNNEIIEQRDKFEEAMKKIWTFEEYFGI
jgi:hypothetical protein